MKRTIKRISLIMAFSSMFAVLTSVCAFSATYYIDWNNGSDGNTGTSKTRAWKRAPGMQDFLGTYTHKPGDTFIFKGGVTWPSASLPLVISYSGTTGKIDTYTTDHTWHTGEGWSQPVFNGGGDKDKLFHVSQKSHWKFSDIKITGVGKANVANHFTGMYVKNSSYFEIDNCTIAPECWQAIYIINQSGTIQKSYSVHHNDISHTAVGIIGNTYGPNSIILGMEIYNNAMHDFASQLIGSTHGDGIHLWSQQGEPTNHFDGTKIYNNRFYGDWSYTSSTGSTGYIVLQRNLSNTLVYNNSGANSAPTNNYFMAAFIALWGDGTGAQNYKVFNNSFYSTPNGVSTAVWFNGSLNCSLQNNIFYGTGTGYKVDTDSTSGLVIDYNAVGANMAALFSGANKTWSQWQSMSFDIHGNNKDPFFVSPATADLRLQRGSPCIGIGTNLSSVFTSDLNGNTRSGTWDLGAFHSIQLCGPLK